MFLLKCDQTLVAKVFKVLAFVFVGSKTFWEYIDGWVRYDFLIIENNS